MIIGQIAALQAAWYATASAAVVAAELLMGSAPSLRHLLDFRELRFDTAFGWTLLFAHLGSAGIGCYLLLAIVQRAKQCLDFTCTLFMFHMLFTWSYSSRFPNSLAWWLLVTASITVMAVGGEYLCMRRELEPIDVGRNMTAGRKRHPSTTNGGEEAVELALLESGEANT